MTRTQTQQLGLCQIPNGRIVFFQKPVQRRFINQIGPHMADKSRSFNPFGDFFQNLIDYRASFSIFDRKVVNLVEPFPVRMWVFPTSLWSRLIYGAKIINRQKRAWHRLKHPVTVLIHFEILCNHLHRLHPQGFRKSFNVLFLNTRPQLPAATRTLQAINGC